MPTTIKNLKREFYLQWHLTNNCDMRCSHCYIPNNKKEKLQKNLSLEECIKVIESFKEMSEKLNFSGRIHFSGGNPLLRKDFFEIAYYAKRKGFKIGILGNPTSLLEQTLFDKIRELEINSYQISIDGMENIHNKIRGNNMFKTALLGLEKLVNTKIYSVVMSTVMKDNILEIPELMKTCAAIGVNRFSFARIVPIGNGKKFKNNILSSNEYKTFLKTMYDTYQKIKIKYPNFKMGMRDPLWSLFFYESGFLDVTKSNDSIISGCSVGINSLCIDTDGTVYSCRRLEIPVGNVKNQTLLEIFLYSNELNKEREVERIEVCKDCEVMPYCRGCRAIAKAVNGSYFSRDPQCWKNQY